MSNAPKIGPTKCGNACHAMKMPRIEKIGFAVKPRSARAARTGKTPPMAEAPSSGGNGSMFKTKSRAVNTSRAERETHTAEGQPAPVVAPTTGEKATGAG